MCSLKAFYSKVDIAADPQGLRQVVAAEYRSLSISAMLRAEMREGKLNLYAYGRSMRASPNNHIVVIV